MDQQNIKTSKKKKRSKKKSILTFFLIFILILVGAGTGTVIAVVKTAPNIDVDVLKNLKQSSMMYDKDGNILDKVSGNEENRNIVNIEEIPKDLQNAFIAIEDERFYSHSGIDYKRIVGAVFNNIKTMSKSQGASTLTQQLIKNYALTPEKKFTRKLQEMYLSIQLEKKLSKKKILEAYLNTIYFGKNVFGVENAAKYYFGDKESLSDLSLAECAFIAGSTQNPSKYSPYSGGEVKETSASIERQRTVLNKMLENGYITQKQYEEATTEKFRFKDNRPITTGKAQWFTEPALEQVAEDLAAKEGISSKDAMTRIKYGGYQIHLTVDAKLQETTQNIVNEDKYYSNVYVPSEYKNYSPKENATDEEKKIQPQVAVAIQDYKTGELRAIVGGRGDHVTGSTNRATTPRQPGSAIKPLGVYAPALDLGIVTQGTVIKGTKLKKSESGPYNFTPKNYTYGYYPEAQTVRDAFVQSTNTVAARVGLNVNSERATDYLKNKFHFTTLDKKDKAPAAYTLGGMTEGVKATEMAAAYGVFGNKGQYTKPIMYTKVVDRNGKIILEKETTKSKAVSQSAAYSTLDMMMGVVYDQKGTGKAANFGGMPVAGKTGTTNEDKTVWFAGLTPYYSGAVWIGHDKLSTNISGLKSAATARLWADIMKEAHKNLEYKNFDAPSGFVSVKLCPASGKLFTEQCKAAGETPTTGHYPARSTPSQICDVHNGIKIPNDNDEEESSSDKKNNSSEYKKPYNNDSSDQNNGNENNSGSSSGSTGNKPKPSGGGSSNGKDKPSSGSSGGGSTGNSGGSSGGENPGNSGGSSGGENPGNSGGSSGSETPDPNTSEQPTARINFLQALFGLIF